MVEDEEDYDHIDKIFCECTPERSELIDHVSVIIWDEFMSNHKYCFNSAYNSYNRFQGKVIIVIGDDGQIGPVVVNGKRRDTVHASIITHYLWPRFKIFRLTKNLRLLGVERMLDLSNQQQRDFLERQKNYAKILEQIRVGHRYSDAVQNVTFDDISGEETVRLPYCKYFSETKEALEFVYPQGFQTPDLHKRAILCATNEDVDEWNFKVQEMNPQPYVTLRSANQFKDIDDSKGILKSMLTDDAGMYYRQNGVPDHLLTLKVGDLCFLMRTLNRKEKLSNNQRVRIVQIHRYSITVETVSDHPRQFQIPRIKFQIKLPFGGFVMIRTQFPLRLAYAMTFNKSQGQSIPFTLIDIRHPPFSHGHLYVSMSRATDVDCTAFFCNESQVEAEGVIAINVVYPEMMLDE